MAVTSGLLLALAFPPWNLWPLAWFALVPLAFASLKLSAVNSQPSAQNENPKAKNFRPLSFVLRPFSLVFRSSSFRLGFLTGIVFWLSTLYWLLWLGATAEGIPRWLAWVFAVFAWTSVSAVCAIYFGLWTMGLGALAKHFDATTARGSLAIAALGSCLWVALELIRAHLWVGFPWNQLGVSQGKTLALIQIADVTGVYGLTFLLCSVNLALASRRLSCLVVTALLPMAAVVAGLLKTDFLARPISYETIEVGVVQADIAQNDKWRGANEDKILQTYANLTHRAAAQKQHLIVWPESSTPRMLNFDRPTYATVASLAREGKTFLLVGTNDAEVDEAAQKVKAWGNAAYLLGPDGKFVAAPYWKMRLVPFGEYIPLSGVIAPLKNLAGLPSLTAGSEPRVFSLDLPSPAPAGEGRGEGNPRARFGVLICFEDCFANSARAVVRGGADFLVNITNDAWWGRSAGAEQHLANSVFRAVENRVWLVRAANTGVSCFIDPLGRIEQSVPPFTEGFATDSITLPRERRLTFYTKYGDVFAFACLAVTLAWLAGEGLAYARKRQRNIEERR